MARRPDFGKQQEIWSRKDLDEIMHNLSAQRAWSAGVLPAGLSRMRHHQLKNVSVAARDAGIGASLEAAKEVAQSRRNLISPQSDLYVDKLRLRKGVPGSESMRL